MQLKYQTTHVAFIGKTLAMYLPIILSLKIDSSSEFISFIMIQ